MPELNITGDLTVDEIHKIREFNYEMTKNMTKEERRAYYKNGSERMQNMLKERKLKAGD